MLYGPPGTDKTTFARSLARELGLTAWTVNTTDNDIYTGLDGREACGTHNENKGKEKSWLNALLEKPGNRVMKFNNRVIWITNKERERLFTSIITRHNVGQYFTASDIKALAKNYEVPAVEQYLKAYTTFMNRIWRCTKN